MIILISWIIETNDTIYRYLSAVKLGETIIIDASVLRSGKNLAYTRADVLRKSDNKLLATALHTKAFPLISQNNQIKTN